MNNLLKEKRKQFHLTQKEVARMVGVSERTIISLENRHYKPSILLAYKLAQIFQTDIETLFCLKGEI